MVQYNNAQEKDRIARKGAMLPDGGAMLPDGYILRLVLTSHVSKQGDYKHHFLGKKSVWFEV